MGKGERACSKRTSWSYHGRYDGDVSLFAGEDVAWFLCDYHKT